VRCESGANQIIARAVATIPSNAISSQPGQWLPRGNRPGQVRYIVAGAVKIVSSNGAKITSPATVMNVTVSRADP